MVIRECRDVNKDKLMPNNQTISRWRKGHCNCEDKKLSWSIMNVHNVNILIFNSSLATFEDIQCIKISGNGEKKRESEGKTEVKEVSISMCSFIEFIRKFLLHICIKHYVRIFFGILLKNKELIWNSSKENSGEPRICFR